LPRQGRIAISSVTIWSFRSLGGPRDEIPARAIREIVELLDSGADRELLFWRLNEIPYGAIAQITGRSEEALRTAWSAIGRKIRQRAPGRGVIDSGP